eukprot:scaffold113042_cov68-Cyclotella_meneghiniana.AAC.1
MYTDPEWVASEYLKRCKKGAWKKENTVDSLKCFNLERILTASQFNLETPDEVGMEKWPGLGEDLRFFETLIPAIDCKRHFDHR